MRRRLFAIVGAAAVAVGVGVVAVPEALSAAAPTTLPAGQYTLAADYHKYDSLNSALVAKLGTAAVHTVMDNANHDRSAITDSLGVAGYETGFKFDSGDNG